MFIVGSRDVGDMVRKHQYTRRSYLKYAGAAGVSVAIAGCQGGDGGGDGDGDGSDGGDGTTTAQGNQMDVLTFAAARTGASAPLFYELKNQEFDKDHDLTLDVQYMSVPASEEAVVNEQVEVSWVSVLGTARLNAQGQEMRQLWPSQINNESFVARSNLDIPTDSIKDALQTMADEDITWGTLPEFSTAHSAFVVLAAQHGFDVEDFDIRTGPPPVLTSLCLDGELDGMINVEPGGTQLIASGDFERVFNYHDAWIDATGNPFSQIEIAAYQDTIDEKPEAIRKFFNAYYDASAHLMNNVESLFENYAGTVGISPEQAGPFANYVKDINGYMREYDEGVVEGDKELARQGYELGILENEPDVDEMWIDPREL
jgi:ABC-type nitrate/sulfonate/bicarbonate transport system substrate-binding protein